MKLKDLEENIAHCWRCSHCKWVPAPVSNEFANACPSIEYGNFHAFSGGGKLITAHALTTGDAGYSDEMMESVFACTMCGACDTSCKINHGEMIEPLEVLYALRAKVASDGRSLPVHQTQIGNLRKTGNPFAKPAAERARWAAGLGIADALAAPVDVLLHIGCDSSFDETLWPELRAIVALLRKVGVDFGILYARETASGELAYDLGFQDDARALAMTLGEAIAESKAARVVTCSAGSFSAFRNIWPRVGIAAPAQPVSHITEFVEDLIDSGRLVIAARTTERITYHDPCKLGRLSEVRVPAEPSWTRVLNIMMIHEKPKQILFGNDGLYEAPRHLLKRLGGLDLVEMERNRVASYCCGAKGGGADAFPEFGALAARNRLDEAEKTGASVLVTACGGCQQHLRRQAAADGRAIRVTGIFELLNGGSE